MRCYSVLILVIIYFKNVDSACTPPNMYYIDCSSTRSLNQSIQICNQYGMTLINLTNSSNLVGDINTLNQSLVAVNCYNNFWFSSGNKTGYAGSVGTLGDVLAGILGGVLNLVGGVLNIVLCLLGCPATTTPAPITAAMLVCIRPLQQRVIQKCLTQSVRTDMRSFHFTEQPMYGGILDTFTCRSLTTCSGLCSSDNLCNGISYINGICNLYI